MVSFPETEYIKANYGSCDAEPCPCRKAGKALIDCAHWHPIAANSWEEFRDAIKRREVIL